MEKMKKASLSNLGELNTYYHKCNLIKLIQEDIFDETIGDNLLIFCA